MARSWLQLQTAEGQLLDLHRGSPGVVSDSFFLTPAAGTCRGLLCDEAGLDRSIESCALLVLANPAPPGWGIGCA